MNLESSIGGPNTASQGSAVGENDKITFSTGDMSPVELKEWLRGRIAYYLDQPIESIESSVHLSEYGMDSVYAVSVVADLEDKLGIELGAMTAWESPTIDLLTERLIEEMSG